MKSFEKGDLVRFNPSPLDILDNKQRMEESGLVRDIKVYTIRRVVEDSTNSFVEIEGKLWPSDWFEYDESFSNNSPQFYSVICPSDQLQNEIDTFVKDNPSIVIEYESVRCTHVNSTGHTILYSFFYIL